jgi:hypothetical protein
MFLIVLLFIVVVSLTWMTQLTKCMLDNRLSVNHQSIEKLSLIIQLDDAVKRWSTNHTFHYAFVGENYVMTAVSMFLDSEYEYIRHFTFVTPSLNDYAV